ncbi:lytic transglycosylase domain-containing protein [Priestia sp. SB1]|uniref:lytic transglycosylase domain-containing protein n=1 Tax=Priestia sp. SB1 TaxID=3132359 RepID=UPI003179C9C4
MKTKLEITENENAVVFSGEIGNMQYNSLTVNGDGIVKFKADTIFINGNEVKLFDDEGRQRYESIVFRSTVEDEDSKKEYRGEYKDIINTNAKIYNVDPFLIAAIIKVESNFEPTARSVVSKGLMGLASSTVKSQEVEDAYNPIDNIIGGTKYFSKLLDKYKGDVNKALIAYNAGDKHVGRDTLPIEITNYVSKVNEFYRTCKSN